MARLSAALLCAVLALSAASAAASVHYSFAGQACGTKHVKCKDHLVCEDKVCKVPKGGKCIAREIYCAKGLACVGKGAGKTCEHAPPTTLAKGDRCYSTGPKCAAGLVCNGRCVVEVGPNGWCKGPHRACKAGLSCIRNFCKVPANGDCKVYPGACFHGTVCAGAHYKRRCVYPRGVGKDCGRYPLAICAAGLKCRKNVCSPPRIAEGESCNFRGALCKRDLLCLGHKHEKRCVRPSGDRGECGSLFKVCAKGLECNQAIGKCRDIRGFPGSSCSKGRPCRDGLTCAFGGRARGRRTCLVLGNLGDNCEAGSEFPCSRGLKCKGGFCVY